MDLAEHLAEHDDDGNSPLTGGEPCGYGPCPHFSIEANIWWN